MSDLHARLLAAVRQRMETAQAAAPLLAGEWHTAKSKIPPGTDPPRLNVLDAEDSLVAWDLIDHDADHIAVNDPATIIRHCERDLRVLERHRPQFIYTDPGNRELPGGDAQECAECHVAGEDYDDYGGFKVWPCDEITDLAAAYGIEVDGG